MTFVADHDKHKVNFYLTGVPTIGKFVPRDAEIQKLGKLFFGNTGTVSQNIIVLYSLGGIGKTQLAIEFTQKYCYYFSSVFWLDGTSETSLKQLYTSILQRLPQDKLTADSLEVLKYSPIDIDLAVRECLRWLSLPTNQYWLMIFDNVDRDYYDKDDVQVYNAKSYFPSTTYGSILITSRLTSLRRLGSGLKIGTVETEQARAILESNAGRVIEGKFDSAPL